MGARLTNCGVAAELSPTSQVRKVGLPPLVSDTQDWIYRSRSIDPEILIGFQLGQATLPNLEVGCGVLKW